MHEVEKSDGDVDNIGVALVVDLLLDPVGAGCGSYCSRRLITNLYFSILCVLSSYSMRI